MQNLPDEIKKYIKRLEKKIEELTDELNKIKEEFKEYKKRHPPNTGLKNGKPYFFKSSTQSQKQKKPGAQKMGQLIDDLLSFSRSTRGEMKYEQTDVEKIVNDLVKAHRDIELDRDIEFVVNPLGTVEADKEMLKVVFANLLQNAIKFTIGREKACIEIGGEQKEDHIQFYVKDNGIGFDMKYKDKLFEAFQRLQTDEKFTGSGIGLATVERIVSKHGGNVWAEGEVDKGSTFYFTLPSKTHIEE